MSTKDVIAVICFVVAAILAVVAAFVQPVRPILEPLAIAAIGAGLAIETA